MEPAADNRIVALCVRVAIIIALGMLMWRLADLWLLAFGAILIAVVLRTAAAPIERRFSWSSHWSLAAAALLIALVIGIAVWVAGNAVSQQASDLMHQISQAWSNLKAHSANSRINRIVVNAVENTAGNGLLVRLPKVTGTVFGGVIDTALLLFIGFYLAARPQFYIGGALELLPPPRHKKAADMLALCGRALQLWLRGQLVAMAIIGGMVMLGLWMVGMQSALALGLLAGLGEFIPVAGLFAVTVLSLLLALAQSGSMALWTFAVFAVAQQMESNVVMPKVQEHMVMLPPAVTLLSLMGFALLFGLPGVLVATPMTVVAFVLVKQLYVRETLGEDTPVPGE